MRAPILMTLAILSSFAVSPASAEDVFRIEIGKDYRHYSTIELQRRVWELERAVWQLQRRVFQLEVAGTPTPAAESWLCTISARGDKFVGTGASKAVASAKALEACKAANDGSGFFCSNTTCEQ